MKSARDLHVESDASRRPEFRRRQESSTKSSIDVNEHKCRMRAYVRSIAVVLVVASAVTACGGSESSTTPTTTSTTRQTAPNAVAESTTTSAVASPSTPASQVIEVVVVGGRAAAPASRPVVARGKQVELRVTADVSDEIHLHGYDRSVDTRPGETVSLLFVADLPGIFEVELEKAHRHLFAIEVRP